MKPAKSLLHDSTAARLVTWCALAVLVVASSGCATKHIDLKKMTYEALRREDCRLNQLDEFCQRNYANEYAEYERLRRQFINDTAEPDATLVSRGDFR